MKAGEELADEIDKGSIGLTRRVFPKSQVQSGKRQYTCASFSPWDPAGLVEVSLCLTDTFRKHYLETIHVYIKSDYSVHWLSSKAPLHFELDSSDSELYIFLWINPSSSYPPYLMLTSRYPLVLAEGGLRWTYVGIKPDQHSVFYPLVYFNSFQTWPRSSLPVMQPIGDKACPNISQCLVFQLSCISPARSVGIYSLPLELLDKILGLVYHNSARRHLTDIGTRTPAFPDPRALARLRRVSKTWERLCSVYQPEPEYNARKQQLLRWSPLSAQASGWQSLRYDQSDWIDGINIERLVRRQPGTTKVWTTFLPLEHQKRHGFIQAIAELKQVRELDIYDMDGLWSEEDIVSILTTTSSPIEKIALVFMDLSAPNIPASLTPRLTGKPLVFTSSVVLNYLKFALFVNCASYHASPFRVAAGHS
ncbi:hypothetical protein BT69DRAFT_1318431 [Atractiella rhizophila]|nr:hypothetical protein BT69DRAFT_1318431 [Atractiella rhizophila]